MALRPDIDWKTIDTDKLLGIIPDKEDADFEWKSASTLKNDKEFRERVPKALSAFSNSGGGYLILGIREEKKQDSPIRPTADSIEPCENHSGNQPMAAWLADKMAFSTDYPIRDLRIHQVPVSGKSGRFILVVEIPDSEDAPHKSKHDNIYYARRMHRSEPASHFYLESIRNRPMNCVVSMTPIAIEAGLSDDNRSIFSKIRVSFFNGSHISANTCEIRIYVTTSQSQHTIDVPDDVKKIMLGPALIVNTYVDLLPGIQESRTLEFRSPFQDRSSISAGYITKLLLSLRFVLSTHTQSGYRFREFWAGDLIGEPEIIQVAHRFKALDDQITREITTDFHDTKLNIQGENYAHPWRHPSLAGFTRKWAYKKE